MDDDKIENYYYVTYECRFCNTIIDKEDLDKHQNECKE